MSKLPSPDMIRRIEDAAAALIAAGIPNPTNVQVRDHLGGGSLTTIIPGDARVPRPSARTGPGRNPSGTA